MTDDALRRRADETRTILASCQAILSDDHFVYISGNHGGCWINKDAIFIEPKRIERLAKLLAEALQPVDADIVCGPAVGGLIVAQWTAHALGLPVVYAEHEASHEPGQLRGRFVLRRGYDHVVAGRRVLVVDDIVSSGHSVRETAEAVRRAGGVVSTVGALVYRGNIDALGFGAGNFVYLLEHDIPEWPAADCPLCKRGVPVNREFAHGQDFLESQQGPG